MRHYRRHYIDGSWTTSESPARIEVLDPFTEEVVATVPAGTVNDAESAVFAARRAFDGWSARTVAERAQMLRGVVRELRQRRHELVELMIEELGSPRSAAETVQVDTPIAVLEMICDLAQRIELETRDANVVVLREPIGVVGCITPWNYPLHQVIVKIGSALVMGCTVVLKASELTPLSALVLAESIRRAGIPAGVFNLVSGTGLVVGEVLASHPEVDMVSFTGSTRAGTRVAELAARTVKKVTLELGGKSASIVLDDADLVDAVEETVRRCFANSGQACNALTRMLVPRANLPEAEVAAVAAAAQLTVGDPRDDSTALGPLVSSMQRDRVRDHIDRAVADGARVLCGGSEPPENHPTGYFVAPTVLTDVTPDMAVAREEIFGPVLTIIPYDSTDEALTIANDTDYGLSSAVWGADAATVYDVARRLRSGQVIINGGAWNFAAPFGGYKMSGLGRESGVWGLEEFLEVKALRL
jgi:aldehyde dehydrogenase (NAD+)